MFMELVLQVRAEQHRTKGGGSTHRPLCIAGVVTRTDPAKSGVHPPKMCDRTPARNLPCASCGLLPGRLVALEIDVSSFGVLQALWGVLGRESHFLGCAEEVSETSLLSVVSSPFLHPGAALRPRALRGGGHVPHAHALLRVVRAARPELLGVLNVFHAVRARRLRSNPSTTLRFLLLEPVHRPVRAGFALACFRRSKYAWWALPLTAGPLVAILMGLYPECLYAYVMVTSTEMMPSHHVIRIVNANYQAHKETCAQRIAARLSTALAKYSNSTENT